MMNRNKIKGLSKGVRFSLTVSLKQELSKFATDENYICSGEFKRFLVDHDYADKDDIIDRQYIESMLALAEN